jgi:biopolymer transport protein ExbB
MEETIIYILLGITSVIGLTFIVERGLVLRWAKVVPPDVEAAVAACQQPDDVPALESVCKRYHNAPLSRLLLSAADHLRWPKAENVDALQTRARHEIVRLERGLVVLEIIVGIAPLMGLVGTIIGMIHVFGDVGHAGLNDAAKLAQGIGLILRATLIGLLIAIPALVFWSYYTKKIEMLAVEMETICDEFIRRIYRGQSSADAGEPSRPVEAAE